MEDIALSYRMHASTVASILKEHYQRSGTA